LDRDSRKGTNDETDDKERRMAFVPPVRFLEPNLLDGATLSASSQASGLPVANLANQLRRKVWRTQDAAGVHTATADLGGAETVGALAFTSHNLTRDARVRLEANDADVWTAPSWTSGWIDVHDSLFGWGQGGHGGHGYGGYLLDDEGEGYIHTFVHFFGGEHYRHWRLSIDDSSNPDGHYEIGRLFLGSHFEPQRGFGHGWRVSQVDPSVTGHSLGQAPFSSRREKYFRLSLPFGLAEDDEYWHRFGDLFRRAGVTRDFFLVLLHDPDSTPSQLMRFYGRLERLPEWTAFGPGRGRFNLEFRESR